MPIITLLSDIGTKDEQVTAIKMAVAPLVGFNHIIDVSHTLAKADIRHGAYLTRSSYKHFPKGSIHLLLVGINNHHSERLLLVAYDGHYFLAPDNGILSLALEQHTLSQAWLCHEFTRDATIRDWINEIGKIISQLESNTTPSDIYPACTDYHVYASVEPMLFNNRLDCSILHIDRYGNIIVNIKQEQFYGFIGENKFNIRILSAMAVIDTVSKNYNDVPEGKYLCRFNSSGYLEIAINRSGEGQVIANKKNYRPDINYDKISINKLLV